MNLTELAELVGYGENSGVEFKRDDIRPEKLADEMAALLNLEGGHLLLGIEDDGTVSGLTRSIKSAEEWVMNIARNNLRPAAIPYWETIEWEPGRIVGVISLPPDAPDKPYKAKRASAWVTKVRVGTTSRDATDDEEMRLYQQSGRLQYDRKPVPGTDLKDLDLRRLTNYFRDFRHQECPDQGDEDNWQRLLINTEFMYLDGDRAIPSAGGLLLFGNKPNRYLPHAGINAVVYSGTKKDYAAKERLLLRGPAVTLFSANGDVVETGIIEQALEFVRRHTNVSASIDEGGTRQEHWDYPPDAIREAIVNAIAHRDYTITVTDIELSIYSDRLEVISPGRLPNTVTVEKMRAGYRASRNELIKETLRDYKYLEATGLGIPRKIVAGMLDHNGTDPDLIEDDERFTVRLWKERKD
ncbi:MAG: putative DNA binding domain-containing protein [Chloroflexi bacterium]|nr:putative DNA binding domain-containing protein [Chloroflexota bacterium]